MCRLNVSHRKRMAEEASQITANVNAKGYSLHVYHEVLHELFIFINSDFILPHNHLLFLLLVLLFSLFLLLPSKRGSLSLRPLCIAYIGLTLKNSWFPFQCYDYKHAPHSCGAWKRTQNLGTLHVKQALHQLSFSSSRCRSLLKGESNEKSAEVLQVLVNTGH